MRRRQKTVIRRRKWEEKITRTKRADGKWRVQFTSTKTNWNTQEINHHHLPPSLRQYKPTSACSYRAGSHISPQRTSQQHRALCVIYMRPDVSWKAHSAPSQEKKQVTVESKYSLLVLWPQPFSNLGFRCSFAGALMYSKAKLISQLGLLEKKLPCTTQKPTCTRNLSISPVLE